MKYFTWRTIPSGDGAWKYGLVIQSYYCDVIHPTFTRLEATVEALERSQDVADRFDQSDLEDVLIETKLAFCLAIQSIWERQFRVYLKLYACEFCQDTGVAEKIVHARWPELCQLFHDLRGISLEKFPSFPELDTLCHLGNACRHGDGPSVKKLADRCPEWWRMPSAAALASETDSVFQSNPTISTMIVPMERIKGFADAIVRFWEDVNHINNESCERKSASFLRDINRGRIDRCWLLDTD